MDELALLRDFRLEDAVADGAREHARAALQAAMTRRRRMPQRRYAIALAFVLAALLAAAAYAIVHEFIVGEPAPRELNNEIAYIVGKTLPPSLIPGHTRQELAGKPRVAAVAQTESGPLYLITAPLKDGGECRYRVLPSNRSLGVVGELLFSGSECTGVAHPPTLWLTVETIQLSPRRTVTIAQGYAPHAVRVRIGSRDYQTPFGWFIAVYRGPEPLIAYDSHGRVVGRTTVAPS
jgi:hypothetical protein